MATDFDPRQAWDDIVSTVEGGLEALLTVEGKSRDLVMTRAYTGTAPAFDDFEGQKKAKLRGGSWDLPFYGDFELRDKDGGLISSKAKVPLFRLPQLTPRHAYLLDGSEYQLSNQMRLKPGAYTRVAQNGEVESFFNLARGGMFRMILNPKDGRLRLKVGSSQPAVYPFMKLLGADDANIRAALGDRLYAINSDVNSKVEILKLHKALFRRKAQDSEQAELEILQRFAESEISPETTAITLGKSFERVDGNLLVSAARKLVAVQTGQEEPDRRDSLAFKEFHDPASIFAERLMGPNLREIQFRIRRKLDPLPGRKITNRIREIVEPRRLQSVMNSQFTRSRLAHNPQQINPLEMLQNVGKVTVTGEGGIRDRRMVTIPMRNIEPSQMGFLDPLHTPEGGDIGVSQHLAITTGTRGKELTTSMFNMRTGEFEDKTALEVRTAVVAFPGTFKFHADKKPKATADVVPAYRNGKLVYVNPSEVDYVVPNAKQLLDYSSNLIPFVNSISGARVLMAARHQSQATALKGREVPLVDPEVGGRSLTRTLGGPSGAVEAPVDGVVEEVTKNFIRIKTKDGEVRLPLYDNFPLNGMSYLHNTPTVQEGDRVKAGQVVSDSTFTRNGHLALGKNLLVAYIPRRGDTFEDAIAISESAAEKLTSLHMHREEIGKAEGRTIGKKRFLSYFPARFTPGQVGHIRDNGLPKVGTILKPGDAVALVMRRRDITDVDKKLGRLSRSIVKPFRDEAIDWDEDFDGEVVGVVEEGPETTILIRTEEPLVVGDKISGRHGNKGVVGRIIPDAEMLRTEQGEVIDVILNPLGVPSRVNPSQILETALAKVARKMGRPALIDNFGYENNEDMVQMALDAAGVSDTELLIDPASNLRLKDILVGPQYIMKLDHPIRKKFSARSTGSYVGDLVPAKKSGESAQTIDPLSLFSILGHGNVAANLQEMSGLKSEFRPDVWRAIKLNQPLPPPRPTQAYGRILDIMRAVGVRVEREGSIVRPMPMTDKEILGTARGPITRANMFEASTLKPERGGLFDEVITGGSKGEGWGQIPLSEPIPNPIFELAIRSITQTTEREFRDILEGRACVDQEGKRKKHESDHVGCLTGGEGIQRLLAHVDVAGELVAAKRKVPDAREDQLNSLNRRIRFLSNFQKMGIDPRDLVIRHVPVIPPRLRPVYQGDDGTLIRSDLNFLYRDLILVNNGLKELDLLPNVSDAQKADLRRDVYDATKALFGLGTSLSRPEYVGLTRAVRGQGSPKGGLFQRRVLRRRQEHSGRSTIIPGPSLSVDEVGIPVEMAWKIFEPFVVRKLIVMGQPPTFAEEAVKRQDPIALKKLYEVAGERPVMLNRSPSLHRHSFLAMKPVLVSGQAIQINPLVTKGFNADFDGDSVGLDTPIPLRIRGEIHLLTGRELETLLDPSDGNAVVETQDIEAHTYDGWRPVRSVSFHNVIDKAKYKIRLRNGISFIVSEDHSLMVSRERTRPQDLTVGRELDHCQIQHGGVDRSYEEGVIYGHFLGDGSVEVRKRGGGRLSLACAPEDERAYLVELWKKIFAVHCYVNDVGYFQVSDVALAREFERDCGRYCYGKFVGPELLSRSEEFLKGLLAGYILSDGSVETTRSGSYIIRTWSRSKKLRDGMALVASMIGLQCSVREQEKAGQINYILSLGKEAIKVLDYRCPGKKGELIRQAVYDYEHRRRDSRRSIGDRGFEVLAIEEVEYDDRMLDIEVDDDSHVFTLAHGIVVHNTMSVHVPITDKAVQEAWEMLPSRNAFSASNQFMLAPRHESQLGLYLLTREGKDHGRTFESDVEVLEALDRSDVEMDEVVRIGTRRTTPGRVWANAVLPKAIRRDDLVLDKDTTTTLLVDIAENEPRALAPTLDALKTLGNEAVYRSGFSISLKALRQGREIRDRILRDVERAVASKPPKERPLATVRELDKAANRINDYLFERYPENPFVQMARSGARGSPNQLRQMMVAPLLFQDAEGRTIPYPVLKSYAEGLEPAAWWAASFGGRKGLIDKVKRQSEPGALNKSLIATSIVQQISVKDCGTSRGIPVVVPDRDTLGRVLAVAAGTFRKDEVVTDEVMSALELQGITTITVRSPVTCEAPHGVCSLCYGLDERGRLPNKGMPVGIVSSQALTEPASQAMLSSFHTSGAVGRGEIVSDNMERIRQLLQFPKIYKGKGAIAKIPGRVEKVELNPAGGHLVFVAGEVHMVPPNQEPLVSRGQMVVPGQLLSTGTKDPRDVLEVMGPTATRRYVADSLRDVYKGTGTHIPRRHFEMVSRAVVNTTRILGGDGSGKFMEGDIAPLDAVMAANLRPPQGQARRLPTRQARGMALLEDIHEVGGIGKILGDRDLDFIADVLKMPNLKVNIRPIVHQPVLRGIDIAPLTRRDWLSQMSHRRIDRVFTEGVAQGWESDVKGGLLPAWIYGTMPASALSGT